MMKSWRSHVTAQLQHRDETQKLPYIGVFTTLSRLEERFETRLQILEDVQSNSSGGAEADKSPNPKVLHLQLRETAHLVEKLSQTVSDFTTVLTLKDAELQHWQSRVSQHRQEAVALAKGSRVLQNTLSELEYTVEQQNKELEALRAEQEGLKAELCQTWSQKEELLLRWMQEKREEAERVNKFNAAQERWQRMALEVSKHLKQYTSPEEEEEEEEEGEETTTVNTADSACVAKATKMKRKKK